MYQAVVHGIEEQLTPHYSILTDLRIVSPCCCVCSVVFDDMYQAVVYGIEEQLTGDVRDAVIAFWHTTVEPFFGRQQRQYQQLHTKTELQQLEAEEHAGKASSSSDQVGAISHMWYVSVSCRMARGGACPSV
jgi:hypothetical protein